jgi:glucose-6-phosphate isomerase
VSDALRFEIFSASDSPGGAALPWTDDLPRLATRALAARRSLIARDCAGSEFLGWMDLPVQAEEWRGELSDLARSLRGEVKQLVVCGIGGSYLGARALMEAFAEPGPTGGLILRGPRGRALGPEVHFAGEQLGGQALAGLLHRLRRKTFAVNVISKSGTTLETALAFRFLRELLVTQHGEAADRYILATTDPTGGALRALATARGWRSFPIPPDVGGRFSVLSPVGLLPLAVAGLDIKALLAGARRGRTRFLAGDIPPGDPGAVDVLLANPALHYALLRRHLHAGGKAVELLAVFEPSLARLGDWWAQLFGESEGKGGKGLFPARASYSTDLHSLGQYVQDGPRHLVETFIALDTPPAGLVVPRLVAADGSDDDGDGLAALAGRPLADVNAAAELGTMIAHDAGGVPVLRIILPRLDAESLGELVYFFEASCAVSALLLAVNPFDQPGVETYKREMRTLLAR